MGLKQVCAGIIFCDGKILIGQRRRDKAEAFRWEFPGGKLEENETPEQCLKRELLEEMGLEIKVGKFFMRSEYNGLCLNAFLATCPSTDIPFLTAHEKSVWIEPEALEAYHFAPADVPIVQAFLEAWKKNLSDFSMLVPEIL